MDQRLDQHEVFLSRVCHSGLEMPTKIFTREKSLQRNTGWLSLIVLSGGFEYKPVGEKVVKMH